MQMTNEQTNSGLSIHEQLKKSIAEMEHDKKHNPIKWVAQFREKDEEDRKIIKLGIQQVRHLFCVYFDFDTDDAERTGSSEEEAMQLIEESWGDSETFQWISETQ